jgi:Asp-tRNA(Asn)/Glu-tRNA(Gln) amidotransferase A subunit family amidase
MSAVNEIIWMTATELVTRIRERELSPVEVCQAVLSHIEENDTDIHAFVALDREGAMHTAGEAEAAIERGDDLGPLHGVPVSIKDLFPVAGLPTTLGSKFFENNVTDFDAPAVRRLRDAGAVILGKTNTPAFGHKDMSDNLVAEPTRNPWRRDRTAGGSSGGAAAAIAAGMGPLALGSDGAGSIRIPASLCGIYGLKPSFGRVPYAPNTDYWASRSHIGPMTRTVGDAALMLQVMAGPDPADPLSLDSPQRNYVDDLSADLSGLRVAWSPDLGYTPVDSEIRQLTEAAVARFEQMGCHIEEVADFWPDPLKWHMVVFEGSIAAKQAARAAERPDWIDPSMAEVIRRGSEYSLVDYAAAMEDRSTFYDQATAFMTNYDLLLTPAMPCGAWRYDGTVTEIDGRPTPTMFHRLQFMYPMNATGWPAATVPCGFTSEELPVGLQIVTPWRQDLLCLQASAAYEIAHPWAHNYPEQRI